MLKKIKIANNRIVKIGLTILYMAAYFLTSGLHLHLDLDHIDIDQTNHHSRITWHSHGEFSNKNSFEKSEHIHLNAKLDTPILLQKNLNSSVKGLKYPLVIFPNNVDETYLLKAICINLTNGPPLAKSILLEYIALKSLRASPLT